MDFLRMFPSAPGRGKARSKSFKIAEYKEFIRSTTEVQRRTQGKMMWEEEYYEWAKTTAGGSLSVASAREQWTKMAAEDSGVVRCFDGPAHAPLMLRVVIGVFIDHINSVAAGKELTVGNGVQRNASKEQ
eukprot:6018286-Lingulodinium_polyedra.AAC.1